MRTLLLLVLCLPAAAEFSNGIYWTANATQSNRPHTLFASFKEDEICDFPAPYINGTIKAAWQADEYSRWPASARCPLGSIKKAWVSFHHDQTNGQTYLVEFRDSPVRCHLASNAACEAAGYDEAGMLARAWEAQMVVSAWPSSSGTTTRTLDARTMVDAAKFQYRLRGPVVTQVKVEDTSTARSDDFGWRERRMGRVVQTLTSTGTSFQVAADWSAVSRPFKVFIGGEIISICFVSYDSGTGNSTMTVGTTNGSNTTCAATGGRAQDGTTARTHHGDEKRTFARLMTNHITHVSGLTANSATTSFTVSDTSGITDISFLKIGMEIVRACGVSGNTVTVGLGTFGACVTADYPDNSVGRTFWGTRKAAQYADSDGYGYPVNAPIYNWSTLSDVWVDAHHDRFRSLHPIFILTFYTDWAAEGIEYHMANVWSDRLQDQMYSMTYKRSGDTTVASITGVIHNAMTIHKYPDGPIVGTYASNLGDRKVWDGTAPASVRYNFNHAYLRYAGFVPHDPRIPIDQIALDNLVGTRTFNHTGQAPGWEVSTKGRIPAIADWATPGRANRENCATMFKNYLVTGGREDIAPIPFWQSVGMYAMASPLADAARWQEGMLGNVACAGYAPYHLWEGDTDSSRKFCNATDTTTYKSCTGDNLNLPAFGLPWSIDARPTSYLLNDQSGQNTVAARLLYQGDQSGHGFAFDGNGHWVEQAFIPWLFYGDWLYERSMLDQGAFALMTSHSTNALRLGSLGVPGCTNMCRPISWYLRALIVSAAAQRTGSAAEQYFLSKLRNFGELTEGRFNITNGRYYRPCADANDKTSTLWCYGRRTLENDAPTTENSVPWFGSVFSWGWNQWGNVDQRYSYHIHSFWMENYGRASLGWGKLLGYDSILEPWLTRVYFRDTVERILNPGIGHIFNTGEYRDPAIPCRPEGVAQPTNCSAQTHLSGEQRYYTSYAHWFNSWNTTAKTKVTFDNDQGQRDGYSVIYASTVPFAEGVNIGSGARTGTQAVEKIRFALRYREGRTTEKGMWTFSPQSRHVLEVRAHPTAGGHLQIVHTAPDNGPCTYLVTTGYPASSVDNNETGNIAAGAGMRMVTLAGQGAGVNKYVRVTCGDYARGISAPFTQN